MEEHPKYQARHESEGEHWPITDELVAMARAHREGEEYPTQSSTDVWLNPSPALTGPPVENAQSPGWR